MVSAHEEDQEGVVLRSEKSSCRWGCEQYQRLHRGQVAHGLRGIYKLKNTQNVHVCECTCMCVWESVCFQSITLVYQRE